MYAAVTGSKSSPGATSGLREPEKDARLFPAWPASSPFVTAVGGSGHFVANYNTSVITQYCVEMALEPFADYVSCNKPDSVSRAGRRARAPAVWRCQLVPLVQQRSTQPGLCTVLLVLSSVICSASLTVSPPMAMHAYRDPSSA